MSGGEDYYRLLGVPREAPDREIKRAYYELARELHPDKAPTPDQKRINESRLALISQAYNTLKDATKRAEYDAALKGGTAPTAPSSSGPPNMVPKSSSAPKPAAPGSTPPGKPAAPAAQAPAQAEAPKMKANDMQAQKVAMAQKAFVRGMQHWKTNEFDKALPFFEAAITNDPESEPHYFNKYALCLVRTKGSFSKAVEAAQRAAEMDAYNLEFKFTLAEIYESAGVTSKAKEVYEDIIRWDAENARAKSKLAIIAGSTGPANGGMLAKLMPSLFGKKK